MTTRKKNISVAILAVFTFLIASGIAGFSICHAESIELIHVNQGDPIPDRDFSNDPSLPCQNDETPIEHVFHYSGGHMTTGNAFLAFFFPFILTTWNPSPLVPLVIKTSYALKTMVFRSLLTLETSPDRAPPVIL